MNENNISDENLKLYSNLLKIQNHQQDNIKQRISELDTKLEDLKNINDSNSENIDALLQMAENLDQELEININNSDINQAMSLTTEEKIQIDKLIDEFDEIEKVDYADDWNSFVNNNFDYANNFNLKVNEDSYIGRAH